MLTEEERNDLVEWSDPNKRMFVNVIITREEAARPDFPQLLNAKIENLKNTAGEWIRTNWPETG